MTEQSIKPRNEAFTGIICSRHEASLDGGKTLIILGIIEDLEKQPEKPTVYIHTFLVWDSSTYEPQAKAALKVGHKVRIRSTSVSSEKIPFVSNIDVDTSELAKEFLAAQAKLASGQ